MTTTYTININVEPGARRRGGYQAGDALVCTYEGTFEATVGHTVNADHVLDVAEAIYSRHQRDSRPDGQSGPTVSEGDVIWIDYGGRGQFLAAEDIGFKPVSGADIGPIETQRTWSEVMAAQR